MNEKQAEIAQKHADAMSEHLHRRSVAVILHDANDKPIGVGSGTCIEVGGRHFIGTASHVLENVTAARDIGVMAFGEVGELWRRTPKVVGWGRRGGELADAVDVGWIEIDPRAVPSWIDIWKRVFVPLERISTRHVPAQAHAYVFGQPGEFLRHDALPDGSPILGLKPHPYLTETIAPPVTGSPSDVYLAYPREMQTAAGARQAPEAPGMSGSGVWLVNSSATRVWSPDRAELVAVQRTWREYEYLRCSPMLAWLEMLREDIPAGFAHRDHPFRAIVTGRSGPS